MNKEDKFFSQTNCDRCHKPLLERTMSWFTDQTICGDCSHIEKNIRKELKAAGKDDMEGCGFIPKKDRDY